ncbi:MAG TPA: MFS transporter [Pseudolabrys sp.]|nr:MFS transporter [Pseudolabrys sp.]
MTYSSSADSAPTSSRQLLLSLLLLWLAGASLRFTILAVPPVIPLIHDDLHLSETEVGILTGLPSMLFALAAVPGSLLVARLGARNALLTGLLVTAIGGALRGALPSIAFLYATTVLMGVGVAVMQVTMPPTVRAWLPERIGFATAVYTNGLLFGEILPVALMLPLVLPLAGGWQWAFAWWSVPVVVTAVLIPLLGPQTALPATNASTPRRWWPDWRKPLIWRLGIMLGVVNAMYFGSNAFIPDYLNSCGEGHLISAALTALNVGQLPASFLLLATAERLKGKPWPYVVSGFLGVIGILAIVLGSGWWVVAGASLLGFSAAGTLILALALPPLLSPPDDVHRVTAAMFTISYSCAVIVPVISGLAWDLTGVASTAFMPLALCGLILMWLAPAILHVEQHAAEHAA